MVVRLVPAHLVAELCASEDLMRKLLDRVPNLFSVPSEIEKIDCFSVRFGEEAMGY